MIICRTPFRISFFGGGTDYPIWFQEHGGAVLATSINKYCYLSCRKLPPFFEHKSRIVWSKIERVKSHNDIQHPVVRAVCQFLQVEDGLEIHHDGDLPARSGLGSSSSFTVGLLNALHAYKGTMSEKKRLASEAIYVEQNILGENVGCQDQIASAFGGFNKISFSPNSDFSIAPIIFPKERLGLFQQHLLLFFTGFTRTASTIAEKQIKETPKKELELRKMLGMVDEAIDILCRQGDVSDFGTLLNESWMLKKSISDQISTPAIDEIYRTGINAGALGGKILGAGGGGFLLFFAKPENHSKIISALNGLLNVPFEFEKSGSQIIFYETDNYN
ncbi:MAG: kinase [Legionellales bacterium]|nr:kinase [Legionellales bacterium]